MLEILARNWWIVALRGAAAVLFGVLALVWPGITILVLVILFGAYSLVDGVVAVGSGLFRSTGDASRRIWLLVEGVFGILVGIVAFVWPGITTLALLWVIAFWALLTGIVEIVLAVALRKEIKGEWMLALGGALSVLFGVLLIVWPTAGALTVVFLIGIYAILFGIVLLGLALRLRKLSPGGALLSST
jgi:uncharacterized membrane protein HdeD (DUF308 family)